MSSAPARAHAMQGIADIFLQKTKEDLLCQIVHLTEQPFQKQRVP